jgi:hypothetical protein
MDDRKQKKAPDNYNRLQNKKRKEREETANPAKNFAQKILSATGLPMYLKEETYKENVAKSRNKKEKQGNRNEKRP